MLGSPFKSGKRSNHIGRKKKGDVLRSEAVGEVGLTNRIEKASRVRRIRFHMSQQAEKNALYGSRYKHNGGP